jgi:outer membrane lipoprotein-sorting protein
MTTHPNPTPNETPDALSDESLRAGLAESTENDGTKQMRGALKRFRSDLAHHPYAKRLGRRQQTGASPWLLPSLFVRAGAFACGVLACAVVVTLILASSNAPTWAEVAARFQSVEAFTATFYVKDSENAPPQETKLWVAPGGLARLRTGNLVVFASKGKANAAFDTSMGHRVDARSEVNWILNILGDAERFSLDTVLAEFAGTLVDVTPSLNNTAMLADDLIVFDIEAPDSTQRCRIWALRESRLPLRIQTWDPKSGESTDVILTFPAREPASFFNPEAFARNLLDAEAPTDTPKALPTANATH